jgi:hypothetical protein
MPNRKRKIQQEKATAGMEFSEHVNIAPPKWTTLLSFKSESHPAPALPTSFDIYKLHNSNNWQCLQNKKELEKEESRVDLGSVQGQWQGPEESLELVYRQAKK